MTALIPQSFLDELLTRTDIVELIDSFVPLKKRGKNHLACCPFHSEKTPSFNVLASKQFYHCFGCGESGNAISFLMNYSHLGFVDAVQTLASRLGMEVPRDKGTQPKKNYQTLYQVLQTVSTFYQTELREHGQIAIDYLKSRQVSGAIAKKYQLGYAPAGWHGLENRFKQHRDALVTTGMLIEKDNKSTYDRYRQRIMFPIHDRHGRLIGFGGRAIEADQTPKYLNSPETPIFQKGRELYGLYQVIQHNPTPDYIVVVEGYLDTIALAQHGISQVVATLGTATSSYQIQLLSKYTKKILFCFDGDRAGQQAAWRALESSLPYLNEDLEARFMFLAEGHDPDSFVREHGATAFEDALQDSLTCHQFFFNTLSQEIDLQSLAGKSQLVNKAKPFLAKIPDGPYKQLLIDELARLTRIESHRLTQLTSEKLDTSPQVNLGITRTPTRVALAILLQNPDTIATLRDKLPKTPLEGPNGQLLQDLLNQITNRPDLTTAMLIEPWRDTPVFDSLTKLATWDHQVPEEALANEFVDILCFLGKQNQEQTIAHLLDKSRQSGLTETERNTLQSLLKERHAHTKEKIR